MGHTLQANRSFVHLGAEYQRCQWKEKKMNSPPMAFGIAPAPKGSLLAQVIKLQIHI